MRSTRKAWRVGSPRGHVGASEDEGPKIADKAWACEAVADCVRPLRGSGSRRELCLRRFVLLAFSSLYRYPLTSIYEPTLRWRIHEEPNYHYNTYSIADRLCDQTRLKGPAWPHMSLSRLELVRLPVRLTLTPTHVRPPSVLALNLHPARPSTPYYITPQNPSG